MQLFDTWAGELTREDYREWALPCRRPRDRRHPVRHRARAAPAPVILYVNGCGHLLEAMAESGADVLSIDWRTPLSEARRRLPGARCREISIRVSSSGRRRRCRGGRARRSSETAGLGHIVNLGHGVLPGSRLECVEAFFAAARGPLGAERPRRIRVDGSGRVP